MKPKLILGLALVLCGGLFGCSTTASHSSANLPGAVDPNTGLPVVSPDPGTQVSPQISNQQPALDAAAEEELRNRLFKISKIIDQVIRNSAYNKNWDRDEINSAKDISNDNDDPDLIFAFYYGYHGLGASSSGSINMDNGDCGIAVRAFFQENADKLAKEQERWQKDLWQNQDENVFRQTLEGTDIVIEVNVLTKDKVFVKQFRKKLNE